MYTVKALGQEAKVSCFLVVCWCHVCGAFVELKRSELGASAVPFPFFFNVCLERLYLHGAETIKAGIKRQSSRPPGGTRKAFPVSLEETHSDAQKQLKKT